MDNIVMVRGQAFPDPNGASQAPSEIPMDLTKRNRDQPQDLRVRINGTRTNNPINTTPNHKRKRLESMVNHIRQCSTIRRQRRDIETDSLRARLNAPPVSRDNGTPDTSDTENSDNESLWRPEDIFILSGNSQSSAVQDLSMRCASGSPVPCSSASNTVTDQWTRVDAKTAFWHRAYLPWMAYYAQLVQTETKDDNASDNTLHQRQITPPSPATPSSPPNPVSATSGRKRAPRALSGKHVKHGTGASPSTLITLRQKIEQRQKSQDNNNNHNKSENRSNNKRKNRL